ncbi:TPA: hypothetical protein MIR91_05865 [Klebsiella pneumoniae]|nr:hypothetical protein [Klebsiella pneumoniae]
MLPGGGCALPGLQDPLTGSHSVGPRKRSAAGRWHQTRYPWCCRVAAAPYPAYRLLSQAHTPQARASVAPPGEISGTVLLILPGGGCALPGLQDPLTGSHSVGPRKRSTAGRDFRHGTLDVAGWRLRLTRPTGSSHRLTLRRPAQAQRRRARFQARFP